MPKTYLECLEEFAGLPEDKRGPYLLKHGAFLSANAGLFPAIPNIGSVVTTAGNSLNSLHAIIDLSEAGQDNYDAQFKVCKGIMEANYDGVNLASAGSGVIIGKAGLKATSTNTASIGKPLRAVGAVLSTTGTPNELKLKWDMEDLSRGGIIVTSSNADVTVEILSGLQFRINMGGETALVDIATGHSTIIKNLIGAALVTSILALFNANGISPVVITPATVVPNV